MARLAAAAGIAAGRLPGGRARPRADRATSIPRPRTSRATSSRTPTTSRARPDAAAVLVRGWCSASATVIEPELPARRRPSGCTLREVVTLASVVELETARADGAAAHRRGLPEPAATGMPLQTDPTVIYALRKAGRWDGNIRKRDLEIDSPYNTYRYPGLPPGPIASPGREALRAALHPGRRRRPLLREPQRRLAPVQRDARRARARGGPLPARPRRAAAAGRPPRPRRTPLALMGVRTASRRRRASSTSSPRRAGRACDRRPVAGLGAARAGRVLLLANGRPIGAGDTRADRARGGQPGAGGRLRPRRVPRGRAAVRARSRRAPRLDLPRRSRRSWPRRCSRPRRALLRARRDRHGPRRQAGGRRSSPAWPRPCCSWPWARRRPRDEAAVAAVRLRARHRVWSTSQALWQHPAAVLFLCARAALPGRAPRTTPAWAGRAGPAARPGGGRAPRRRRAGGRARRSASRCAGRARMPALLLWARRAGRRSSSPTTWATSARRCEHGFSGQPRPLLRRRGATATLGLLVSPAKGLLVFTPRRRRGRGRAGARASERGERWLAAHARARPCSRTGRSWAAGANGTAARAGARA